MSGKTDELFSPDSVACDSPRLAWIKKHGVRTHHAKHLSAGEAPWCAWFATNATGVNGDGIPNNPDECGYGDTEDDAIACLATESRTPLWNEESA